MADTYDKFAIYFSHSWHVRDIELNLAVWHELASACEMLVDVPEEPGTTPPYYINRIEELLRQCDLFFCVLTKRETKAGDGYGDGAMYCSPYSLFEIRLAERLDIPRCILYERGSLFRSPRIHRSCETYIAFDRGTHDTLPDRPKYSSGTFLL